MNEICVAINNMTSGEVYKCTIKHIDTYLVIDFSIKLFRFVIYHFLCKKKSSNDYLSNSSDHVNHPEQL